jgi:hypothetical protein
MNTSPVISSFTGIILLVCTVSCNPFDRRGSSFINFSLPGNEQRVVIRDNETSLDIRYSGDIVFNDEETAIERMSANAYLDYRKNGRRLFATSSSNGNVVYEFSNDDRPVNGDDNGKRFLVEAIHEMIAQGMFIKGRMERLYQEGGVTLLMAELKRTKADHVKRTYIEYILQKDSISKEQVSDIATIIGNTFGSDDDKRKMLEKICYRYLSDSTTAAAYYAAINTINSDNDKANALRHTLKEPLSNSTFNQFVKVAGTINSDNDKANLLKDVIHNGIFPGESYNEILDAINAINSDNDKANVLKMLVEKEIFTGEPFNRLLEVIGKINSDNDKANVFKKLAAQNITHDEQWIAFINKTAGIFSDNDKANVLVEISRKMPKSESVAAAFMATSKTLNSESDYKRAVQSVL